MEIVPFDKSYDRKGFACGVEPLDRYLKTQANREVRLGVSTCFLAVEGKSILGFYTLSAGSVVLTELPDDVAKKLPRYPQVPVARLGRLAVAEAAQGKGLGGELLWDALSRLKRQTDMGIWACVTDPKDEAAAKFYAHHGFAYCGSAMFIALGAL